MGSKYLGSLCLRKSRASNCWKLKEYFGKHCICLPCTLAPGLGRFGPCLWKWPHGRFSAADSRHCWDTSGNTAPSLPDTGDLSWLQQEEIGRVTVPGLEAIAAGWCGYTFMTSQERVLASNEATLSLLPYFDWY